MIHIKINEQLEKQGKTIYWLSKECKCNYANLKKLASNNTDSIKFSLLETICEVLQCDLPDIMELVKEKVE
ncbi:helix-turn-helix domain-containing protein [Clostridium thailandense]|uniref:helix-turn-helix domain-containing protein n=1 Tax=Clostridium thailandense TaxID=2794346 RepID=UPI003988F9F4